MPLTLPRTDLLPLRTLNCRGTLLSLEQPRIMGILNLTPDSFSDGGQFMTADAALRQAETLLREGADILDIGGYSSRPGAEEVPVAEEMRRVLPVTERIREVFPEAILSTDTFRAAVAAEMLDRGVHILNDITAGADPDMFPLAARTGAPLVLMHMQGSPQTMQVQPQYQDVTAEVWQFFVERIRQARAAGVRDLILDPGFGFGKSLAHNYTLFRHLDRFRQAGLPLLIGISRKRMIRSLGGDTPEQMAELTAALHLQGLQQGVCLLRVHDVAAARRIIRLSEALEHGTV